MKMEFFTTLFFIFLVAKLFGAIQWSWWWITAPLWMPIVLGIVVLIIALILSSI